MSLTSIEQSVIQSVANGINNLKNELGQINTAGASQAVNDTVDKVNNSLDEALKWLAAHGQQPGVTNNEDPSQENSQQGSA